VNSAGAWEAIALSLVPVVPLVAAVLLLFKGRTAAVASWLAAVAALPALAAAFLAAETELSLPWLLLGARIGLDETGQAFLALTAFLWLCAGIYARDYLSHAPNASRFFRYSLLTMSGNFGLVVALDAPTFFAFYTLMSFAAYGLIVHERTPENIRAGKIYIALVLVGEVMVFSGMVLGVNPSAHDSLSWASHEVNTYAVIFLVLGFGIRVGVLPTHFWLPLAHPAAPTPASAVLSGAMLKAGVLGWLRFLPLGAIELPELGALCAVAGLLAVVFGVFVGLWQRDAKVVLAYSSISQMGYITLAVGVGFLMPSLWPALLSAVVLYVVHHGLAKAALFLGVGLAATERRRFTAVFLFIPMLAMAGAPLTSGASAKDALKQAIGSANYAPDEWLGILFGLGAFLTALLMARFMCAVHALGDAKHGLGMTAWAVWCAILAAMAAMPWWLPGATPSATWSAMIPVALGAACGAIVQWYRPQLADSRVPAWIPSGDIVVIVERAWAFVRRFSGSVISGEAEAEAQAVSAAAERLGRIMMGVRILERRLFNWRFVGLVLLSFLAFLSLLDLNDVN
jgi:formate hydrogenlyase subunit 3/multisubunit Na+/H+ antiporter MnhD subunit